MRGMLLWVGLSLCSGVALASTGMRDLPAPARAAKDAALERTVDLWLLRETEFGGFAIPAQAVVRVPAQGAATWEHVSSVQFQPACQAHEPDGQQPLAPGSACNGPAKALTLTISLRQQENQLHYQVQVNGARRHGMLVPHTWEGSLSPGLHTLDLGLLAGPAAYSLQLRF